MLNFDNFEISGERENHDSNSLIDYFKGQFSILNDVSIKTNTAQYG